MSTYSVWLTLERASTASTQFQQIIADLADTAADAPEFDPHLTLVGGVDGDLERVTRAARTVAETTEPLDIAMGDIQWSTTSHQCVFCLIEPSLPLFRARRQAMTALDRPETMYVPHLSLIYSDMSLARRAALADAIDTTALPDRVRVTSIKVVDTTGPVATWEPRRSFELSS